MLAMTERFHDLSTGDYELDRLRQYLSDWQAMQKPIQATTTGLPGSVPWIQYMKPNIPWDNEETDRETVNFAAMKIVDQSMDELYAAQPESAIAIRWRYLNINVGAFVFRHNRLKGLTIEQLEDLADGGERLLLPIVKRRGLIL